MGSTSVNKQNSKNMFLRNFDFMVKSLYTEKICLEISPKYLIFQNAPDTIFDLYGINFLCTNSETFISFLTIVLIDCTYLLDYTVKQQYLSEAFSVALSFQIGSCNSCCNSKSHFWINPHPNHILWLLSKFKLQKLSWLTKFCYWLNLNVVCGYM